MSTVATSSTTTPAQIQEEQLLRLFKSVVEKIVAGSSSTASSIENNSDNNDLFSASFYSQVHAEAADLMEHCCELGFKSNQNTNSISRTISRIGASKESSGREGVEEPTINAINDTTFRLPSPPIGASRESDGAPSVRANKGDETISSLKVLSITAL